MSLQDKARKLRPLIEKAAVSLPDEDALKAVELFQKWKVDTAYSADERVRYAGKLYRVVQAHTSQADWTPDATPALFTEVSPPGVIPIWKQPTGTQDAYNIGDRVHYPYADSPIYESVIDGNVWSPIEYSPGWRLV